MLGWYLGLPPRVRGWARYVGAAVALTFAVGILGFAAGLESAPATSTPIRAAGEPAPDLSVLGLFVHNAGIAVRSAFGLLTMGVYTVYVLLINGVTIGATVADAAEQHGLAWALLAIVPHGVVEIPALWLSGAIGLRWLAFVWAVASGDRDRIAGSWLVVESLALVGLSLALLLLAAVIEVHVTAALV